MPNDIDTPTPGNTSDQMEDYVLSEQESEQMDNDLFEVEMICRARCVSVPDHSNVVVEEIEDKQTEG